MGEREDLTHRTRGFMSNKGKERERSPLPITALESEVKGDRKELEKKQEVWVLSDEEQELQLFFARKPSNKLRKPSTSSLTPSCTLLAIDCGRQTRLGNELLILQSHACRREERSALLINRHRFLLRLRQRPLLLPRLQHPFAPKTRSRPPASRRSTAPGPGESSQELGEECGVPSGCGEGF